MSSRLSIDASSGCASKPENDELHYSNIGAASSRTPTVVIASPSSKIDENESLWIETDANSSTVPTIPKALVTTEAGTATYLSPRTDSAMSSSSTITRPATLSQDEIASLLSRKDLLNADYNWLEYLSQQQKIDKADLRAGDILYFPVLPLRLSDNLISVLCSANASRTRAMSDHPVVILDTMAHDTTKVKICFVSEHWLSTTF
jgi:hypothetical protein